MSNRNIRITDLDGRERVPEDEYGQLASGEGRTSVGLSAEEAEELFEWQLLNPTPFTARFWRVRSLRQINGVNEGGASPKSWILRELQGFDQNGTLISESATPISSGTFSGPLPDLAFINNGNLTDEGWWSLSGNFGQYEWVGLDFGAGNNKLLNRVELVQYAPGWYAVPDVTLECSTDGINWFEVGRVENWPYAAVQTILRTNDLLDTPAFIAAQANAGPNQVVNDVDGDGSQNVTLDGSATVQGSNTITDYDWTWSGGSASGQTTNVTLPVGETQVTLTTTDSEGETDVDTVTIDVNARPISVPGPNQTVDDIGNTGSQSVLMDGTGSSDSDGTIVAYNWSWTDGGPQTASGAGPTITLPLGTTTVSLTVTDDQGNTSAPQTVDITVQAVGGPATYDSITASRVGSGYPWTTIFTGKPALILNDIVLAHFDKTRRNNASIGGYRLAVLNSSGIVQSTHDIPAGNVRNTSGEAWQWTTEVKGLGISIPAGGGVAIQGLNPLLLNIGQIGATNTLGFGGGYLGEATPDFFVGQDLSGVSVGPMMARWGVVE